MYVYAHLGGYMTHYYVTIVLRASSLLVSDAHACIINQPSNSG